MMKVSRVDFDTIYQENYQRIFRLCMGYVNGNEPHAKDLTQEVFLKVWENLWSFRKEAGIATWIYRIAVNTCLLELRKKRFTREAEVLERLSPVEDEQDSSRERQLIQMYDCIHKLSKESKGIILLELEGLPQKEIATIMGISHEAVRVRVHRIKNSLTKCVTNGKL